MSSGGHNDIMQPAADLNDSKNPSSDAQIRALADRLERHVASIEYLAELRLQRKYRKKMKASNDETAD